MTRSPLTLQIREATPNERAERLSCLLCGERNCTYVVTFRTWNRNRVALGLHATCFDWNQTEADQCHDEAEEEDPATVLVTLGGQLAEREIADRLIGEGAAEEAILDALDGGELDR